VFVYLVVPKTSSVSRCADGHRWVIGTSAVSIDYTVYNIEKFIVVCVPYDRCSSGPSLVRGIRSSMSVR